MSKRKKIICWCTMAAVLNAIVLMTQAGCNRNSITQDTTIIDTHSPGSNVLAQIAHQTGGKYYGGLETAMESQFAITQAANSFLGDRSLFLKGVIPPFQIETGDNTSTSIRVPFVIDPSIKKIWLTVGHTGGPDGASLELLKPDGSTMTAHISTNNPDGRVMYDFDFANLPPGEWALVGTRQPETAIEYFAHVKAPGGPDLSWITMEESPDGGEYLIVVSLRGDVSIDGAKVVGQIQQENGEITSCVFSNFATGIYGAEYRPRETGHVRVTVTASNPDKTAFTTWRDVLIDSFGDEEIRVPEDAPITNNFIRMVFERVHVNAYRVKRREQL